MVDYKEYIKSEEWKRKAQLRKNFDGGRCQMCGETINLDTHHSTYDNLGNEDIKRELKTLCDRCHKIVTNDNKERKKEFKKAKSRVRDNRINRHCIKSYDNDYSTFWW